MLVTIGVLLSTGRSEQNGQRQENHPSKIAHFNQLSTGPIMIKYQ